MAKDINRIKVVLVEHKRTNKWLAEQLGINPTTVSKRVCQNVHILFFMHKAPTFSSQGFAIS